MCRIGINLSNTTPNGTTISSAIGQYRVVGSATLVNFPILLSNPETPDITTIGDYELRVNVTNNINDTSEWSNIVTFSVSTDCSGGDGPIERCNLWRLNVRSQTSIPQGERVSITYEDCNGNEVFEEFTPSQITTFCASNILDANLGPGTPQVIDGNQVNDGGWATLEMIEIDSPNCT